LDWLIALKAVILGIVEGLTEFLPISSTGHLIVAESLLKFRIASLPVFTIAIQAAAILAICWEYRARLLHMARGLGNDPREQRLALNLCVAFLPAAVLGVLFKRAIESALFRPLPVAMAWIIGAVVILWVERVHAAKNYAPRIGSMDEIGWLDALKIGCAQSLALIPGTSRSGATIIGGLIFGLSRTAATQFSFFLAIPTLIGATVFSLYKARHQLTAAELPLYGISSLFAFFAALVCVRWLLRYIATHDFRAFAWYRIVFGALILVSATQGWIEWNSDAG
jgi:undecaprenyl-diphosphatase